MLIGSENEREIFTNVGTIVCCSILDKRPFRTCDDQCEESYADTDTYECQCLSEYMSVGMKHMVHYRENMKNKT